MSTRDRQRSAKIGQLRREGYPAAQAAAIAYREYGENPRSKAAMILHLKATNDVNGNPRRLYLVVRTDGSADLYDEGYAGFFQIPEQDRRAEVVNIDITNKAYSNLLKVAESEDAYHAHVRRGKLY